MPMAMVGRLRPGRLRWPVWLLRRLRNVRGGELEIDHFHPLAAGGSDDIENLVYACTACNRFKGDYAPAHDAPESLRLLRPQRDDFGAHVEETVHGRLIGLTPRGWFHIQRLHLNRPQLIERRHLLHVLQAQRSDLSRSREAEARLRRENEALQGEITRLRAAVAAGRSTAPRGRHR
ncbi:HNH endonuclease [Sorangium sp. So ce1078]|uniref:HNH endonuclease n=1 Tax=Sorangium sp. So ce1078 TaxID=3133329 RepID=UPI003F644456